MSCSYLGLCLSNQYLASSQVVRGQFNEQLLRCCGRADPAAQLIRQRHRTSSHCVQIPKANADNTPLASPWWDLLGEYLHAGAYKRLEFLHLLRKHVLLFRRKAAIDETQELIFFLNYMVLNDVAEFGRKANELRMLALIGGA